VRTLENFQWSEEPCFAGTTILKGMWLLLIHRWGKHVISNLISALWRVSFMLALKPSLLNRDSNICPEGLGFYHFYMQSPGNPLIEDYTDIFYMTDEGNILSTQRNVSLSL
jgi:hypothetical protein